MENYKIKTRTTYIAMFCFSISVLEIGWSVSTNGRLLSDKETDKTITRDTDATKKSHFRD